MYRVKMISQDDNIFLFDSKEETEMAAILEAEKKIIDNGWEHHQYCYDSIVKLKKAFGDE